MQWPIPTPTLAGQIVVLEPLCVEHLAALFAAARPPEIWQWWPFNPATDAESFEQWVKDAVQATAAGDRLQFATLEAGTGRPIGSSSYCTPRPEHRGLEIGWTWLAPAAWNTGANAEAKLLMLDHAFAHAGCQRVEFETDEQNARSRRALRALPAHFEGVLRDHKVLPDGRRRSSALFSVLDTEWPAVRANLKRRVAAAVEYRRRPVG